MGIRINPVSWQVFYADNFAIFLSMKRNIFPGGHAEPSKYGPYAMYLFEFNKYLFKTEFGMVIAYIQLKIFNRYKMVIIFQFNFFA